LPCIDAGSSAVCWDGWTTPLGLDLSERWRIVCTFWVNAVPDPARIAIGGLPAQAGRLACDTTYLREVRIVATTMVHVRVDEKTKEKAAKTLAGMGISVPCSQPARIAAPPAARQRSHRPALPHPQIAY